MADPPDPAAFFRDMLGQWEKMTNQVGGEALKTGAFARAMQGANAATMQAQGAAHQVMERALAAANMPNRGEVTDLSARLARIEEAVARIEAAVMAQGVTAQGATMQAGVTPPARPKPARTRKTPDTPTAE